MITERYSLSLAAVLLTAVALGSFFLAGASPTRAAQYVVTDLGPAEHDGSWASDINNYGQVVGNSWNTFGISDHSTFLWTPDEPNGLTGTAINLGPDEFAGGRRINDYGQVVDHSRLWMPTTPNGTTGSAVTRETLLGVDGFSGFSPIRDINNYGQLVGCYQLGEDHPGYLWTPTTPNGSSGSHVLLEPPEGFTHVEPLAINNGGQVTGQSSFLWTPTTPNGSSGTAVDLGGLPGYQFHFAFDINDRGQVAGHSYGQDTDIRVFLWTPTTPGGTTGTLIDLGEDCWSGAYPDGCGINAHGHVVGGGFAGAFLYTPETGRVDLNTLIDPLSGWQLHSANSINDFGQIVGFGDKLGEDGEFYPRGFLLTPVSLIDLPGDYNRDGTVNAADYVVWRNGLGSSFTPAHYDVWRANFGRSLAAASSAPGSAGGVSPIPEPAGAVLLLVSVATFVATARRRHADC